MAIDIYPKLTPEPEAIPEARHALDRLADLLAPEKLEDVRLVVSELVTNSVLHAGLSPDEQEAGVEARHYLEGWLGDGCCSRAGWRRAGNRDPRPVRKWLARGPLVSA